MLMGRTKCLIAALNLSQMVRWPWDHAYMPFITYSCSLCVIFQLIIVCSDRELYGLTEVKTQVPNNDWRIYLRIAVYGDCSWTQCHSSRCGQQVPLWWWSVADSRSHPREGLGQPLPAGIRSCLRCWCTPHLDCMATDDGAQCTRSHLQTTTRHHHHHQ